MANRSDRLKHLMQLQRQVTEIHEMRRANFLARAVAAGREAAEILERRGGDDSLSHLFPDVYSRFVEKALERQGENQALAAAESLKVAAETARTNMIEDSWRAARRDEDRKAEERAGLDAVEQRLALEQSRRT